MQTKRFLILFIAVLLVFSLGGFSKNKQETVEKKLVKRAAAIHEKVPLGMGDVVVVGGTGYGAFGLWGPDDVDAQELPMMLFARADKSVSRA